MKSLSYILLAFLLVITYGCKEEDHPYVGYIVIDRAVLEATGSSSTTLTADTDIPDEIKLVEIDEEGADWCSVSINGKQLTVTATQANPSTEDFRTATVTVKCGYRTASFTVLQKFEGQQYLQYDWSTWTATGSDVQTDDGGGYPSLFTEERTTFWHSQWSPALDQPLPHFLIIDMKEELSVAAFRIGRRAYGEVNYPSVKKMEIYTSTDNETFTQVKGLTFELPWTAPDGTVVNGNSTLVPPYEEIILSEVVNARYVKLIITETNNTNGAAQVSYFKAMEKI